MKRFTTSFIVFLSATILIAASPAFAALDEYQEILRTGGSNEQVVDALSHLSYAGNLSSFWNYVRYLDYEAGESEGGNAYTVRKAAAEALGRIKDERSVPILIERFKKEKVDAVRAAILHSLEFYPKADSSAVLSEGLSSPNEECRFRAMMSAAILVRKDLLGQIKSMLSTEKDEPMKLTISYALMALGDDIDGNRKALIAGLNSKDPVVRYRAADYIGRLKVVQAASDVARAIEIENRYWVRAELDRTLTVLYVERRRIREADEAEAMGYGEKPAPQPKQDPAPDQTKN
jgi:HEAT repeat protein